MTPRHDSDAPAAGTEEFVSDASDVAPALQAATAEARVPRRWLDWRVLPVLVLTVAILWWLIGSLAGAETFASAFSRADPSYVGLAVVLAVANLFLGVLRWKLIVDAMGTRVSYRRCLHAVLATWPLALVVPARAGDVLRALAIRDRVPVIEGMGSVLLEKAIDVQSLCLLAVVGCVALRQPALAVVPAGLGLAAWGFLVAMRYWRDAVLRLVPGARTRTKLSRLGAPLDGLAGRPVHALAVLASSVAAWLFAASIVHALLQATSAGVPAMATLALWPLAVFGGLVPLTLAGMGTRDAAFLYLLPAVGVRVSEGPVIAATVGYAIVGTWLFAAVGLPFAIRFALTVRAATGAASRPA